MTKYIEAIEAAIENCYKDASVHVNYDISPEEQHHYDNSKQIDKAQKLFQNFVQTIRFLRKTRNGGQYYLDEVLEMEVSSND